MDYFSNMQFIYFSENLDYRGIIENRYFEYYGLQYNHSGTLIYEGERYHGSYWFLTCPGRPYSYRSPKGESRHHCYICVLGPRVDEMLQKKLLLRTDFPIQVNKPDHMLWKIQNIITCLRTPGYLNYAKATHLFEGLLLFLQEDFKSQNNISPRLEPQLRQLMLEIQDQPDLDWNFAVIAQEMQLSESHFRFCFKQLTSYAPTQFLIECRLNRATSLLRNKQYTIGEIARKCGFNDQFYFSRIFKKHRGFSPQRYFNEME